MATCRCQQSSLRASLKRGTNSLKFTTGEILDFLIDEVVKLQRLHDISLELWRQEGRLNLLEEQLANGALELGSDGLRLHADLHLRDLPGTIRLDRSRKQTAECGLVLV